MAQLVTVLAFYDPSGAPLANGSVTFDLSFDISTASAGGTQVAARRQVVATLDANGICSVNLWANNTDDNGSVYFVNAYTAQGQGQPVWSGQITVL
jgi:hypothetical protein